MSVFNRSFRTATRNLRRAPLSLAQRATIQASQHTPTFRKFSVMPPLQSGAPPPPQAREYDPEIKDIANYVHNTPINSDLAVSFPHFAPDSPTDVGIV